MKDLRSRITQIIEDTCHSGRADELIEEIIKPMAEESFKAGKKHEYLCHFGSIARENESNLENWIKEKFGVTSNKQ